MYGIHPVFYMPYFLHHNVLITLPQGQEHIRNYHRYVYGFINTLVCIKLLCRLILLHQPSHSCMQHRKHMSSNKKFDAVSYCGLGLSTGLVCCTIYMYTMEWDDHVLSWSGLWSNYNNDYYWLPEIFHGLREITWRQLFMAVVKSGFDTPTQHMHQKHITKARKWMYPCIWNRDRERERGPQYRTMLPIPWPFVYVEWNRYKLWSNNSHVQIIRYNLINRLSTHEKN